MRVLNPVRTSFSANETFGHTRLNFGQIWEEKPALTWAERDTEGGFKSSGRNLAELKKFQSRFALRSKICLNQKTRAVNIPELWCLGQI